MPSRERLLSAGTLHADRRALQNLQKLLDYQPLNPAYNILTLEQLELTLARAEQAEADAMQALKQARMVRLATAWAFHDAMLGAKNQVIAQYGDDAYIIKAIGRVRKSDRKRPARRNAPAL